MNQKVLKCYIRLDILLLPQVYAFYSKWRLTVHDQVCVSLIEQRLVCPQKQMKKKCLQRNDKARREWRTVSQRLVVFLKKTGATKKKRKDLQ